MVEIKLERVEVYRNLHTGTLSVRSCKTGRVIAHPTEITLALPKFVVQQGGRERVLRERKKYVHAFVRGYVSERGLAPQCGGRMAIYNPFKVSTFVDADEGTPVYCAEFATVTTAGVEYWNA